MDVDPPLYDLIVSSFSSQFLIQNSSNFIAYSLQISEALAHFWAVSSPLLCYFVSWSICEVLVGPLTFFHLLSQIHFSNGIALSLQTRTSETIEIAVRCSLLFLLIFICLFKETSVWHRISDNHFLIALVSDALVIYWLLVYVVTSMQLDRHFMNCY